jgi:hypothetical protein
MVSEQTGFPRALATPVFFRAPRVGWLCVALLQGSCGVMSWEERELAGEGSLCLSAEATPFGEMPVRLEADAPLRITVNAPLCLSGSCSRNRRGSCHVALQGHELVVASEFSWEEKTRGSCTEDCNSIAASCASPPLPPGEYMVIHGGEQHGIMVPSVRAQSCLTAP